ELTDGVDEHLGLCVRGPGLRAAFLRKTKEEVRPADETCRLEGFPIRVECGVARRALRRPDEREAERALRLRGHPARVLVVVYTGAVDPKQHDRPSPPRPPTTERFYILYNAPMSPRAKSLVVLALMALLVSLETSRLGNPDPAPADAPAEQFSATR